jgi:predicted site-specific integrase-resolvase
MRSIIREELQQMMHQEKAEIVSPEELCKRLGISIPTQIAYRRSGKLPFLKITDRKVGYDFNKVVAALEKKKR